MRIYVNNKAKVLEVTISDPDVDVDATALPVTFTGFDGFYEDDIIRFGPTVITDKVYHPPVGDTRGFTVLVMPWQDADVAEPSGYGGIRLQVDIDWVEGPQTIRPLQLIKIRA